jgi:hypothetical protein
MNREGKSRLMCVAAGGVCGLGLMSSAIASPPISRGRSSLSAVDSVRSVLVTNRSLVHQEYPSSQRLDLRPPGDSPPAAAKVGAPALALTRFPTAIHHLDISKADRGTDDRVHLPALGSGGETFRTMSQAEIIARRIHREGLPVARLWESRSAFISIGLNQKGKPGLWLTQKVP